MFREQRIYFLVAQFVVLVDECAVADERYILVLMHAILHAIFLVERIAAGIFERDEIPGLDLHGTNASCLVPISGNALARAYCDDEAARVFLARDDVEDLGLPALDGSDEDEVEQGLEHQRCACCAGSQVTALPVMRQVCMMPVAVSMRTMLVPSEVAV